MDTLDRDYLVAMSRDEITSARLEAVDRLCVAACQDQDRTNRNTAVDYLERIRNAIGVDAAVRERATRGLLFG